MNYTIAALEKKILEMYPEIGAHGITMDVVFNEEKSAYIIGFGRDGKALTTHLEKKDADECMNGIKCVYLGVQVEQFIKNFEERK